MDDFVDRRIALLVTTSGAFLTTFVVSSVNIAVPSIGSEFMMDAVMLTWIATSFLLAAAVFLVPFGRIADMYGRRRIFVYGISIFTISSFLLGISNSAVLFISLRILQGVGGAMIYGTSLAILTSVFRVGERGKAIGINTAAVYIGLSAGPFFGGFLTQNFGWRSIFLVNVPIGLMILALIFWKLKVEWAEARGEKFDFRGSILYGLALIAMIYGLSALPAASGIYLILTGALGISAFIWWEIRIKNPILNMNLFKKNKVFLFSNLAALISYSATYAVVFLMSLYLQHIKGFNPQDAGLILVSQPIMQAIFSPLAGRLSDKFEPQSISSAGMALTAAGLFLFTFLNDGTSLQFIVANLMLLGFGFALFSSPNTNAVMCSVERRYYGVAAGTLATMRSMGQMLSMGIAMLVFATLIGRVQIRPEYYPLFLSSVNTSFIIFASLCGVGIFASLARGKLRRCQA